MSTINRDYLNWLIAELGDGAVGYTTLAEQLHCHPFRWSVMMDENRASDGVGLRSEYLGAFGDPSIFGARPCSVLEMLVALIRTMALQTTGLNLGVGVAGWFQIILRNLGLVRAFDQAYVANPDDTWDYVDNIVDLFLDRKYSAYGEGGLFPLEDPKEDQRRVELWYQFNTYLIEKSDDLC